MAKGYSFYRFVRDNGLLLFMFGVFAATLVGVSITGFQYENEQLQTHHQPGQSYLQYLASGDFIEAVFENWESEFLQMAALVIATIFLRQRGSADSKKMQGREAVDTSSRYSIIKGRSMAARTKAVGELLYANSLSIALLALFVLSFVLHAIGGAQAHNDEALAHGEPTLSVLQYVLGAQFWFESFQNWQSEFLAVGALLLLSIFLRQRGSPESKLIGEANKKTGR